MSRFTARILSSSDEALWAALWQRVDGSLGLHWRWCACAAAGVGEPLRVGIFSSDGQLIAGIPFVQRRRRMRTEWHHPSPASHAGLMASQDLMNSETALREIFEALSALTQRATTRAEMVLPPQVADVRGLLWQGWSAQPHYNYVSMIEEPGALARQSENAARRQGAKAEAAGFVLETGNHLRAEIFALWEKTQIRQNIPAYIHTSCYDMLLEESEGDGRGISGLAAAVRNPTTKRIEAAAIIGQDSQRAYYLLGASDPDVEEAHGAPTYLHFALSDHLFKNRGKFAYDWVGANTPHIAQFKKKFRPRLETYLRCAQRQGMARIIP